MTTGFPEPPGGWAAWGGGPGTAGYSGIGGSSGGDSGGGYVGETPPGAENATYDPATGHWVFPGGRRRRYSDGNWYAVESGGYTSGGDSGGGYVGETPPGAENATYDPATGHWVFPGGRRRRYSDGNWYAVESGGYTSGGDSGGGYVGETPPGAENATYDPATGHWVFPGGRRRRYSDGNWYAVESGGYTSGGSNTMPEPMEFIYGTDGGGGGGGNGGSVSVGDDALDQYMTPSYGAGVRPQFDFSDQESWAKHHMWRSNRWNTFLAALEDDPNWSYLSPYMQETEMRRRFNPLNAQHAIDSLMGIIKGGQNVTPWTSSMSREGGGYDIFGGLGQAWNALTNAGDSVDVNAIKEFSGDLPDLLLDALLQGKTGANRRYAERAFQNRRKDLTAKSGPEEFDLFNAWRAGRLGDLLGLGFSNRANP